jgi:hypothetical protein
VLAPLLLSIAMLVKLSSPGGVLYAQERMGLAGSQLSDAQVSLDAGRCRGEDGRDLGAGHRRAPHRLWDVSSRKSSLDELPQLWNVLLGDMSLDGAAPGAGPCS